MGQTFYQRNTRTINAMKKGEKIIHTSVNATGQIVATTNRGRIFIQEAEKGADGTIKLLPKMFLFKHEITL
jgi:hypothetical protein